mgnify:FL=1
MARKPKGSLKPTLHELSTAIDNAIGEVTDEVRAAVDRGLDKAALHMEQALEAATPVETGEVKRSWKVDFKYRNVRYINNTATRPKTPGDKITSGDGEIPIVNLLEFGKKGKPFVRRTVQAEQAKAIEIIKEEIRNG